MSLGKRRCDIDSEVTHKAWLNRSNILFTGSDKWSLDPRVTIINNNKSEFSIQIERVTVHDEGPYTCSYQARNEPRTAHVYLIQMKKSDSCSFSCVLTRKKGDISSIYFELKNAENVCASFFLSVPAKIVNISADISVNEGSNVNLFCLAVGRPEPTITWRHLKYGFMSEGEFLDITDIKRQQAEEYECITNNGVSTPDTRKVKVIVNYPPVISDAKNMPGEVGKTAILRCEAMAVPTASFEWLLERSHGLKIQNEKTRSLLMFTNVTAQHFGNYTCFAANKLGTSNSSMLLFSEYLSAQRVFIPTAQSF
ncbi:IgLON family member 5 [Acipenser ruthenus]|uniref:IgLON family member 5 n=1 Tax=Acipenser ruthenus TaxID=7906 RepID=A0A444V4W7_ACIRT|nr:IgLON family member 5 [Acipenser ruthenus]